MTAAAKVHYAKTHFSRLLARAQAGEEIVLAMAGKAHPRLVPLKEPARQRWPGRLKGSLSSAFFEPLHDQDLALWEGSEEQA